MRRRRWAELKPPYINLGPMVDISLSLLVIFVLAIPFLIESGLFVSKAAVAKGKAAQRLQAKKEDVKVNLYLRSDGTIFLNKEPVTEDQLRELLPQLLARSISRKVLLSADNEVIYDDVIKMIDLVKNLGAEDVLILKRKES